MTTFRVKKTINYSVIPNGLIEDRSLSWDARGLLVYLLSKPDDWQVKFTDLVRQSPAGPSKVKRILKELETAGYMVRMRKQDNKGKFIWETHVYENPQKSAENARLSIDGKTIDGKTIDGKPIDILNTESINTESPNTDLKENDKNPKDLLSAAKNPRKSNKTDIRLKHPALAAFRSVNRFHVDQSMRDMVIETVGDVSGNVDKWRDVVRLYRGKGYNPRNIVNQLRIFQEGWGGGPNGGGKKDINAKLALVDKVYANET